VVVPWVLGARDLGVEPVRPAYGYAVVELGDPGLVEPLLDVARPLGEAVVSQVAPHCTGNQEPHQGQVDDEQPYHLTVRDEEKLVFPWFFCHRLLREP
jgi:hypothetical protein